MLLYDSKSDFYELNHAALSYFKILSKSAFRLLRAKELCKSMSDIRYRLILLNALSERSFTAQCKLTTANLLMQCLVYLLPRYDFLLLFSVVRNNVDRGFHNQILVGKL